MNETANPQPARRAGSARFVFHLSGDPLMPGVTAMCTGLNGWVKVIAAVLVYFDALLASVAQPAPIDGNSRTYTVSVSIEKREFHW